MLVGRSELVTITGTRLISASTGHAGIQIQRKGKALFLIECNKQTSLGSSTRLGVARSLDERVREIVRDFDESLFNLFLWVTRALIAAARA